MNMDSWERASLRALYGYWDDEDDEEYYPRPEKEKEDDYEKYGY